MRTQPPAFAPSKRKASHHPLGDRLSRPQPCRQSRGPQVAGGHGAHSRRHSSRLRRGAVCLRALGPARSRRALPARHRHGRRLPHRRRAYADAVSKASPPRCTPWEPSPPARPSRSSARSSTSRNTGRPRCCCGRWPPSPAGRCCATRRNKRWRCCCCPRGSFPNSPSASTATSATPFIWAGSTFVWAILYLTFFAGSRRKAVQGILFAVSAICAVYGMVLMLASWVFVLLRSDLHSLRHARLGLGRHRRRAAPHRRISRPQGPGSHRRRHRIRRLRCRGATHTWTETV